MIENDTIFFFISIVKSGFQNRFANDIINLFIFYKKNMKHVILLQDLIMYYIVLNQRFSNGFLSTVNNSSSTLYFFTTAVNFLNINLLIIIL